MKVRIYKEFDFESAQQLPHVGADHPCSKLHGHSFRVEVGVDGEVNPETGWLYDHACISEAMKPLVAQLDHSYLNDIPGLENPTIENMAAWMWKRLAPSLPGLAEIIIHETTRARVSYCGK